jgi:hypothetical protein
MAIRRLLGRTGTEISREKFCRLGNISTECKDTSQTAPPWRQLGGEDNVKLTGKAKAKAKVKVTGKANVKVKVQAKMYSPTAPFFDERFPRNEGKNVARSGSEQKTFSFSSPLILDEGGLRDGRAKSAYSLLAAAAAT